MPLVPVRPVPDPGIAEHTRDVIAPKQDHCFMCVIIGNHGAASRGAGRREVLRPGFGFFHSMSMYRLERCCLRRCRQTEPRFRSPRRRSCSECRICVPAEIPEERLASTSYRPKSRCRTCGGLATQPKPYSPALALTLVGPAAEGPRERTSALTRPGSCRWPSCAAIPARTLDITKPVCGAG